MLTDFDFDVSVEDAWRAFRIDLADQLSQLDHGDEHTVVQSTDEFPDGPHGKLTFTVIGSRRVRCSVAVSDLHTTDDCRLDQMSQLFGMGFRPLQAGDRPIIIECGRRRIDELAAISVRALRQIWEVVHPTFLVGGERAGGREPSMPVGVTPHDPDDLRRLVLESLARQVSHPVIVDDDGDIRVPTGEVSSWMRMCTDEPAIEFFACIVSSVPDAFEAAHFIATRAARWPSITLRLIESSVYASLRLECSVFYDANLTSAAKKWIAFVIDDVPQIREELATPRLAWKPEPEAAEDELPALPDQLMAVLHLIDDGPTTPDEVAQVCDLNRRTIIDCIKVCNRERGKWSRYGEEADDPDEVEACARETDKWLSTMKLLVAALRLVLKFDRRRRYYAELQARKAATNDH